MRPGAVAVVSVASAVLAAIAVLAVGRAAGWIGASAQRTVVVTAPAGLSPAAPAAVTSTARPLVGNGFDPAQIYANRASGVVTIFSYFGNAALGASQGSGFVVSSRGYVLTNSHVITTAGEGSGPVQAAARLYVEFGDHDRIPATIVGWDVFDDVGLIKVDPRQHALVPVPLGDSAHVVVGEPVAAIGSPFGNEDSLAVGVVSATHRSISSLTSAYHLIDAIQTDAPITHGNSGGPLFDARGRVIGINAQIRSQSGTGNDGGVGFAVAIDSAKRSFDQLLSSGHVAYAYVGIRTEDLTPSLARHFGYKVLRGAVIDQVTPRSAGAQAGLVGGTQTQSFAGLDFTKGGDVITAIDGTPVQSADDVVRIVGEHLLPGQVATFTIIRNGLQKSVRVRMGSRPGGGG